MNRRSLLLGALTAPVAALAWKRKRHRRWDPLAWEEARRLAPWIEAYTPSMVPCSQDEAPKLFPRNRPTVYIPREGSVLLEDGVPHFRNCHFAWPQENA